MFPKFLGDRQDDMVIKGLAEASEVCRALEGVLGSVVTSWVSHLALTLVSQPLLGKFQFLLLWTMAFIMVLML